MKVIVFLWLFLMVMRAEAQDMYARAEHPGTENRIEMKVSDGEESYRWEFWAVGEVVGRKSTKIAEILYGKEAAGLLALLDERYLKKEQVDAGDPSLCTVVRKPAVYNAVKNIERYYKRKCRKNGSSSADQEMLAYVVKVALACVDSENTADFETVLEQKRKDVAGQIACFRQVRLKNLYE